MTPTAALLASSSVCRLNRLWEGGASLGLGAAMNAFSSFGAPASGLLTFPNGLLVGGFAATTGALAATLGAGAATARFAATARARWLAFPAPLVAPASIFARSPRATA